MKLINKIKSIVGLKPTAKRVRAFQAASVGRLTSSWTTQTKKSDEVLRNELTILRARSRDQVDNNDYARRFINLLKTNVVGHNGFKFQACTCRKNGDKDKPANIALESAWKDWGKVGNCEITGKLSFIDSCNLSISTIAADGEVIIHKVFGRGAGKYDFQIRFIDAELLDVNFNTELRGGNFVRMGIEFTPLGKPIAYFFKTLDERLEYYSYQGSKYNRIPAHDIIHKFITERISQKRGVPWMVSALARMEMLNGYEEAALVNARAGASKMGIIVTPDGNNYNSDDTDDDDNVIEDTEPGTVIQLAEGQQWTDYDPAYPSGEFAPFVKNILRGISSGLGVSYNTLANDLEGVNFSSIRAGVLEDREAWKAIQRFFIENILTDIYESWLTIQLFLGNIPINNSYLSILSEEKYKNVSFQGRRWSWVDPFKDVKANKEAIDARIKSLSSVIREQGGDPDEVFNEIAEEQKRMKELGIEPILDQMANIADNVTNTDDNNEN